MIAVRNSTKTISVEVTRYDKVGQTLGILLNNQKQKISIGVIYGSQVNMTQNNELKLLHKTIAEQIEIIKEKYQQVLMVRGFKCKYRKPHFRQQRNSIKRRKTAQNNN